MSAVVGATTVALTLLSKLVVSRPDPHGVAGDHGGAFPSGHTVSVMVCLGLAVILFRPEGGRAAWALPGGIGVLMAGSLVVQGAHWATDVLGGALLAVTVLAAASAAGCGGLITPAGRPSNRKPFQ